MDYLESWVLRTRREAPNTCVVSAERGSQPSATVIQVRGGAGSFTMYGDFDWRITQYAPRKLERGKFVDLTDAWARFLDMERA